MVTIKDVAKYAGVSVATVSNALTAAEERLSEAIAILNAAEARAEEAAAI